MKKISKNTMAIILAALVGVSSFSIVPVQAATIDEPLISNSIETNTKAANEDSVGVQSESIVGAEQTTSSGFK